jgi:hypothetical protein
MSFSLYERVLFQVNLLIQINKQVPPDYNPRNLFAPASLIEPKVATGSFTLLSSIMAEMI